MATTVSITSEYITLGQLLKDEGVVDSGGAAKYFLANNQVQVNGELDDRRGRKLYPGDSVDAAGQQFTVAKA